MEKGMFVKVLVSRKFAGGEKGTAGHRLLDFCLQVHSLIFSLSYFRCIHLDTQQP